MKSFVLILAVLVSECVLASLSCTSFLNTEVFFKIKDYEQVKQALVEAVSLSKDEQKLIDDFRDKGELFAEYERYGESYRHAANGLDPVQLETFMNDLKNLFKNKFPTYEGVVFRSVTIEGPNESTSFDWPSELVWKSYRDQIFNLQPGSKLVADSIWSTSKKYGVARTFQGNPKSERVIFVINIKTGVDLANLAENEYVNLGSNFTREMPSHEVVILTETKFKVMKILKSKDPAIASIIVLEEE